MKSEFRNNFHDNSDRLRWLTFYRVVIISFLLGIAAFIQFVGTETLTQKSLYLVYAIIGVTYILSIIYVLVLKRLINVTFNVYVQSVIDVAIITALVYVTGGAGSVYPNLYSLVIIYSVLFLERKGGIFVASVSGIFYGMLLDLEYYGIINPVYGEMYVYDYSAGYIFSRIFIHIVSFYIIAFLASFVVEQERKTRTLLNEREDAFKQLDSLHRCIIESVNAGIVTIDGFRNVRSFNRAAEILTGMNQDEALDQNIDVIFPGILSSMEKCENGTGSFELQFSSDEGKELILGFSLSMLVGPALENIGDILIIQDLTAIKLMEREVEKNKKMAFMGEMAAVLAHELRNPLASIGGSIQLLKRDLFLEEGDKKLMDIVLRGKDQLETLARDFLLFTRPVRGGDESIDIEEVIEDILESIQFGRDWNVMIEISKKFAPEHVIYGNRMEVRHTIFNIMMNALQAMPNGGALSIITVLRKDDISGQNFLEIRIADNGCGIDSKIISRIKEPFFTTKETGTGLGLAIVHRIVEGHNGYFSIQSEGDKGTLCVVGFPFASIIYKKEELLYG
ncbi:MAG: ATP-binding protein [Syntrophales bacterium]|nr:ATP-binding protein [Syntrophales bacterium]